ncbi:rhodanese-like domain-containing protein [Fuchsiella alkaliacetigena]|uniref:rhodanese-like domain-containing protein n=1 Tax=Fuchsiella alkaliacetigena TaxID=957042 RepID=UPI00200B653B|nr:rhodanese-like domain-containing protein [Fuchsiella alkaliacetigena]MCK8825467.1 rhodanese-like domain-containing protein [Fuchsiella alkaliacetigena]
MKFGKKALLVVLSVIIIFSLIGCRDETETIDGDELVEEQELVSLEDHAYYNYQEQELEGDQFEALLEVADNYLQDNYQDSITPREVYEKVVLNPDSDYYVVDLRGLDDFAEASIIGSVNMPYDSIWERHQIEKLPRDKKIIIVCYTGHTANQAAAFWGMLGFDTVAMENGFAGWDASVECAPEDYELATEPTEATEKFDLPQIEQEVTTIDELIMEQGRRIVDDNINPVMRYDQVKRFVIDRGSERHFAVDLRDSDLYEKGHGEGAINIPFKELTDPSNLEKLPTDKDIVLICSDGYKSSQAARILNILGYDALASQFGMSQWTADEEVIGDQPVICRDVADYPTVETRIETPEAEAG